MILKPGLRLRSQVGETEMVVIKGSGDHELACGGVAVVPLGEPVAEGVEMASGQDGAALMGKRHQARTRCPLPRRPAARGQVGQGPAGLRLNKALPASD